MSEFQYKPLTEPDSIRLLILQPGSFEQEIHCSLIRTTISHCDRDIVNHYIAISYVWGDPNEKRRVYVDGNPVLIGANLEAALRDIRDEVGTLRIWADALCVDQLNLEERSSQVGLMGKIYSTAQHTVIHLSHDDGQKILEAIPGNTTGNTTPWVHEELLAAAENTLMKTSWFRRVWILQELVLSKNPWLQCGTVRAKWSELCKILLNLNQRDKPLSKEMAVLEDSISFGLQDGLRK